MKSNYDELIKELECILPSEIDDESMGGKENVVCKYMTIRAGLFHRAYELSVSSYNALQSENIVSAKLLARALMETVSVLAFLYYKIKAFNNDKNIDSFNDTVMRILLGTRVSDEGKSSINILTMIDRVDREMDGYRLTYDLLSEYCHPNLLGTCALYGVTKEGKNTKFNKVPQEVEKYKIELYDSICLSINVLKQYTISTTNIIEDFVDKVNSITHPD